MPTQIPTPTSTPETTLDLAPIGRPVRVVSITGDDGVARRLADLGVRPGIAVECLRRAPLGDPSVFELCGYQLCLRRSESARVRVVEIEAGAGRGERDGGRQNARARAALR